MPAVPIKPIEAPPALVGPDYNLYQYRHDFYKVVHFRSTEPRMALHNRDKSEGFKYDDKLPQALSRARRVVLELAMVFIDFPELPQFSHTAILLRKQDTAYQIKRLIV